MIDDAFAQWSARLQAVMHEGAKSIREAFRSAIFDAVTRAGAR